MVTHTLSAISFAAMHADIAAMAYAIGGTRSAIRLTKQGTKHKKLVAAFSVAAMAGVAATLAEDSLDWLPFLAVVSGSLGDYQGQGRYQRLILLFGALVMLPVSIAKRNWAMAASDVITAGIFANAIFKHDIKGASGTINKPVKDLQSYIFGIFNNAATGAERKGQISLDAGHQDIQEQYHALLGKKPNPFFETQPALLRTSDPPSAHI